MLMVVLKFPFHPDICMTMTLTEQRTVLFSNHPCVSPLPHKTSTISEDLERKCLPWLTSVHEIMIFFLLVSLVSPFLEHSLVLVKGLA